MNRVLLSLLFVTGIACAQAPVQPLPASAAKTAPPVAAIVQQVRVAPGALTGRVVHAGTRRSVPAHSFALLDHTGKKVGDLTTTAAGTYVTPTLAAGNYTLRVRDDLDLHLAVDGAAKIRELDIVLPQGPLKKPLSPQNPATLPAAPGGAAPALPAPIAAPGISGLTWAVAAGGAAAAVAVPVVANNSGGSDENPVSSSGLGIRR